MTTDAVTPIITDSFLTVKVNIWHGTELVLFGQWLNYVKL